MIDSGITASPEQLTAAESEWSTEDFLVAEPYPLPEITPESLKAYLGSAAAETTDSGTTEPGDTPNSSPTGSGDDQATTGYPYPPPMNQHEVLAAYTTYPSCTIGKLFFKQGSGSYVASAASIGNNAIWTAGHCVHTGNNSPTGWTTNVVFVPAYKNSAAPYGPFTAKQLFCRTKWYQSGNPGGLYEDMGAAILNPLNGKSIRLTVGWLGFAWNFPRDQVWTSLGYPAAPPFTGQPMFKDTAPYANDGSAPGSPHPVGIGCSMTWGCSGGPGVMGFGSANQSTATTAAGPTASRWKVIAAGS